MELKARFDESANIHWAQRAGGGRRPRRLRHRRPEDPRKCVLVVRREGDGVRSYVHIGTGNYNPKTARIYTDFGLFTANQEIGDDIAEMFNYLTGYARPSGYRKVLVAPVQPARRGSSARSSGRSRRTQPERPARIRMKMNSLLDPPMHPGALPRLAGGRGGRPQRPRHLRAAARRAGRLARTSGSSRSSAASSSTRGSTRSSGPTRRKILIGSADLMPRNLYNRVELVTPVEDQVEPRPAHRRSRSRVRRQHQRVGAGQ